tara:strand:+ start:203 stop:781 length:579 start_codon:yes stop_codon:yes gene_type:complete
MHNYDTLTFPFGYEAIRIATESLGFTMPSDIKTCSFLKTLATSKRHSKFLELGTGTGLSTSWILSGMDKYSTLTSIDYDDILLSIAHDNLGADARLTLVSSDCEDWIHENEKLRFDYIFADTWHGKYLLLDEVLAMLNPGGIYIVDDMLPQDNWPEGHAEKAALLTKTLSERNDLCITKLNWATGIIFAVKI